MKTAFTFEFNIWFMWGKGVLLEGTRFGHRQQLHTVALLAGQLGAHLEGVEGGGGVVTTEIAANIIMIIIIYEAWSSV